MSASTDDGDARIRYDGKELASREAAVCLLGAAGEAGGTGLRPVHLGNVGSYATSKENAPA